MWILGAPFFRAARAITFERASRTVGVDTRPLEAAPGHDAPAAPAGIARVRVVEVPFGPEDADGAVEEPEPGDGGIEQLEKNSLEATSLADAAAALGMADGSGGLHGLHVAQHGRGAHGAQPAAGALLPGEVSGLDDL